MHTRRTILGGLAGTVSFGFSAPAAFAKDIAEASYPTKPIQLIVPYPPGGAADMLARYVGHMLTEAWNQQVVVDSKAGAAATVGSAFVARAQPDGYTLLVGPLGVFTVAPLLFKSLSFDPIKDLQPITQGAVVNSILVVRSDLPIKSVSELIAAAKAKPGTMHYGAGGIGTSDHLAGEVFRDLTGADIVDVQYKGGAPTITALLGGEIEMIFGVVPLLLPHIESGKFRALAVTGTKRLSILPNVPTMIEAGVPNYNMSTWFGFFAPAGTPAEIVNKLSREIGTALKSAGFNQKFTSQGFEAAPSTPEEFGAQIRADRARLESIVKKLNIQPQ